MTWNMSFEPNLLSTVQCSLGVIHASFSCESATGHVKKKKKKKDNSSRDRGQKVMQRHFCGRGG